MAFGKSQKQIVVISISSVVLVVIVVSAVVGTKQSNNGNHNGVESQSQSQSQSAMGSIKAVCDTTLYPDTCYASISPLVNSINIQPDELLKLTVLVGINELSKVSKLMELKNCSELLDLALDHLNDSLSATDVDSKPIGGSRLDNIITWVSAAGTYQQTCLDNIKENVVVHLQKSTELTSNILAIAKGFSRIVNSYNRRRLMNIAAGYSETPEWVYFKDRKLLQNATLPPGIKADVVVAQDGSGLYKKISDALNAVPDKSEKRFVIHVKKGVYFENVRIEKSKWNVMMIGDGMDSTIVSGSLNVIDGTPTFSSATFAVFGQGFIGSNMGFRNTAGAVKHQAVALLSTADRSAFYQCRIDAFQDSLYAHSNRQFYRECNIYGTVDFIFGNSAVVFQNCNILPRQPLPGQQNTITAQGKFDPNQNTGISIQNCTVWPYGNLSGVQTFLGRPWKNYSTTVFINNMMGSLIDPTGWLPWAGTTAPDTIFYAEFANYGPGAVTKNRVKWKGLKFITSKQASKFTVNSFINGEKWINGTGIAYKHGL